MCGVIIKGFYSFDVQSNGFALGFFDLAWSSQVRSIFISRGTINECMLCVCLSNLKL